MMTQIRPKSVTKTRRGHGTLPYRLLTTLLYGRHKWIERDGATARIPCAKLASHFKTKAYRIQAMLYLLEDWELIESVSWNRCWTTVRLKIPDYIQQEQLREVTIVD